jgi:hypothetical protein
MSNVMCKKVRMLRTIIVLLLSSSAYASSLIDDLESRNKIDISTPNGNKYEMDAIGVFWGSPHFMMECLPPGSQLHKPFTIFFEVLENGKMGQLAYREEDSVTDCISRNVKNREFPIPLKPFVVRIDLSFTE